MPEKIPTIEPRLEALRGLGLGGLFVILETAGSSWYGPYLDREEAAGRLGRRDGLGLEIRGRVVQVPK